MRELRHWLEWRPGWVILGLTVAFALFAAAAEAAAWTFSKSWAGLAIAYVATAVFLLYVLVTVVAACRVRGGAMKELGLGLAFVIGMVVFHPQLLALAALALGAGGKDLRPIVRLAEAPGLWALGNLCVVLAAAFFGRLVSRLVREAALLPVVAVVASGIDLWGVYWGPVGHLTSTQQGQELARQFSAAIPAVGAAAKAGLPVLGAIGMGDFLFLGLFFFALRRLRLNQVGAFWATFGIMLVAPLFYLLGKALPIAENLPGLPFIALGMIVSNWKHWKLTREEKRHVAVGAVIMAAVIVAILLVKRLVK